jgi:hypothetical protein
MLATALLLAGVRFVKVFLTPIVWTGYTLSVDGAVYAARGRSLVTTAPRAFGCLAAVSVPLWLVFEAYNLRLENWRYEGLPEQTAARILGYLWSFATIWPAVLVTTDFLLATRKQSTDAPRRGLAPWWCFVGAGLLLTPLLVPKDASQYLFGLVWVGFVFLLDPLNAKAGRPSAIANRSRFSALLGAGTICGFVWEFWNYWATARWVYTFPIFQDWKVFEMPIPGYLGFPAFALEIFTMYTFVAARLKLPYYEVK